MITKCNGKTVVKNFGGFVDHYDHDSAAYAVKYGKIRFVHLHNYPTFRRSELTGVASTLHFLKEEVEWANRTGDYLVLMIHDVGNKFGEGHSLKSSRKFAQDTPTTWTEWSMSKTSLQAAIQQFRKLMWHC